MPDAVDLAVTWAAGGSTDARSARVGRLVATTLAEDTAIRQLLAEAAQGAVTERTRLRAALALEEHAESHPDFARELDAALAGTADLPVVASAARFVGYRPDAVVADDVDVVTSLFFGRDDAEHDVADGLLREGFLPTTAFTEAASGRKSLIIGRKGSGKSAICMRLHLGEAGPDRSFLITPDDAAGAELRRFELDGLTAPVAKSLLWRYVFAVHAARFLVRNGKRKWGRQPSSIAALERFLRENGELAEERFYDRVVRASHGLTSSFSLEAFGIKVAVDGNKTPQGVRASRQLEVIESAVRRAFGDYAGNGENAALLMLVDQLEQVWSAELASEALVIGLLLAGKSATLTYAGALRCVFFLRSDIYDALDFGDADKFHSDEIRIDWTVDQLRELALTRASASLGRRLTPDELWGEVFPRSVFEEKIEEYLFRRVLPRPRDAIQFLNQCRDVAFQKGHHRIEVADVSQATLVFSRWKLLDLAKEYRVRFPFLDSLLTVFRDSGYRLTRTSIARLFQPFQAGLRSRHRRYAHWFDPDAIIELLYSVGFLGVRRGDGYVYAGTAEAAVQPTESEFCIHPCFRPALNADRPEHVQVYNEVTGTVVGHVVQAGNIEGYVYFGGTNAGQEVVVRPRPDDEADDGD